jgi:hypothetical protein
MDRLDAEYRRLKPSPQIAAKLKAHIQARSLAPGALMFARRAPQPAPLRAVTDPSTLGLTESNEAGRQYRHTQGDLKAGRGWRGGPGVHGRAAATVRSGC